MVLALVCAGAAALTFVALGDEDEATTIYYVTRMSKLPPGVTDAYLLLVNETLLSSFPMPVREAFLQAVEEGNSTVPLRDSEGWALVHLLNEARREQGKPEAGYFEVRGAILEMSGRSGHS